MKKFLLLLSVGAAFSAGAQQRQLEKIWQTDSIVAVPESVLPHGKKTLYVSLINGGPWDADGKGGIARIRSNGKKYDSTWITGLHAPKGMGIHGNRLYVADISDVVVVDIKRGAIEKRIGVSGAQGLNDVTVGPNGVVYVSDSRTGRIWRIENDQPALYLENMNGVNGIKAVGNDLVIAAGRSFLKADAQKNTTRIAELPAGGDGIEPVGNGDYLVTTWSGAIYYVQADGRVDTLLDTQQQKRNTADIGYDPKKRIVYVPTFFARSVDAYRLK